MKSIEYLKTELKKRSVLFASIRIRYEFRSSTGTHVIEVMPSSIFSDNKNYIDSEIKLESTFENLFPNENILFIDNDSLTEVSNPIFQIGYETTTLIERIPVSVEESIVTGYSTSLCGGFNYALAA
jgi:hypothetical protein